MNKKCKINKLKWTIQNKLYNIKLKNNKLKILFNIIK
jgi:hypothetical protein